MIRLLVIPAPLMGALIVAIVVTLSLIGLRYFRRRWPQDQLKESNDVSDPIYSMVGVLYSVLLAFMVVVVWEDFTKAKLHTELEASAIGDLLRESQSFPPAQREVIHERLIAYARDVIDREWPLMARGKDVELESPSFRGLWSSYIAFKPEGNEEVAFYTDSIARLNELSSNRKERILCSESELPGILWVLLIGGSMISIAFTFLFGTANHTVHTLIVTMLSALLSFVLFMIFSLEHPYSGSISVKPSSFQRVIAAHARE